MDELVGFLDKRGFSTLNTLLVALLFYVFKTGFKHFTDDIGEITERVNALWDWHLIQKGKEEAEKRNNHGQ